MPFLCLRLKMLTDHINSTNQTVSVQILPVYLPKNEVTVPSSPGLLWYTSSPPKASAGVIDCR